MALTFPKNVSPCSIPVTVTYDGRLPEELILRTNPHFRENVTSRVYFLRGGKFRPDSLLGDWCDSVKSYPVVVRGTRIPFHELLQTSVSEKYKAFQSNIEWEHYHHELKKCGAVIKTSQRIGPLKDYMLKKIDSEIKYIVLDRTFVKVMRKAAELAKPFTEYGLILTADKVIWHSK